MTKSAQEALRRTMEVYSKTTRFCLLCNYVSRIIDPITSRTAKFRFRLLPSEIQRRQIDMIVEKERVNISQNGIDKLIEGKNQFIQKLWFFILTLVAGGDMRRAI